MKVGVRVIIGGGLDTRTTAVTSSLTRPPFEDCWMSHMNGNVTRSDRDIIDVM